MRSVVLLSLIVLIPGISLAGFAICDAPGVQMEPVIGFDGVNYLIVWDDGRGMYNQLYGARVTPSGVVLDTGGIRLLGESDLQQHPVIAFDGTHYLVAWQFGC
jgi:hypothetical protein